MSHNTGVLPEPCACWPCPLLYPLCSARLPGRWARHVRTAALSVPSFIRAITESKPAETSLSRDRTPPYWVWLGQDPIKPGGEGHPRPWLLLAMISEPLLKKGPDLIWAGSPPLKSCLWFGFCCLEREERGQAAHRQEKAQAKGSALVGGWGWGWGGCADSHAPGADGTLFYVWPQWIMSAKRLGGAYNMEGSHKNIVNRNSKIR